MVGDRSSWFIFVSWMAHTSIFSAFSRSSSSTVLDFKPSAFHCMILIESRVWVGWDSEISLIGTAGLAKFGFTGLLQLLQIQAVADPSKMALITSLPRPVHIWWKCFLHRSQVIADDNFFEEISGFLWLVPAGPASDTTCFWRYAIFKRGGRFHAIEEDSFKQEGR